MANVFHELSFGICVKVAIRLGNDLVVYVPLPQVSEGLDQKAAGLAGSCHVSRCGPLQSNLSVANLYRAGKTVRRIDDLHRHLGGELSRFAA